MVHLRPLPGAPLFGGSIDAVIESALRDARAIVKGGADGIVIENFGDRPFYKNHVPAETVAAMTRVISALLPEIKLRFGVNVLRNDASSALAIAAATGAVFIRVNVHTGAVLADQGVIEGEAVETLRRRAALAANVAIFADHRVKHSVPLAETDPLQDARNLRLRGLADALIISGVETGAAASREALAELRRAIDAPILVGSGVTAKNARDYADADGVIVGTSIKEKGDVAAAVDATRLEKLVRAFKRGAGR
jgi:membrane complex biogenesis BtpA family protein